MAKNTTIKLPPKLKARLAALAKKSGRSTHGLILEALERHAEWEERMEAFIREALEAGAEIDRTEEVYCAEDVHGWIERLAKRDSPAPPTPRRE